MANLSFNRVFKNSFVLLLALMCTQIASALSTASSDINNAIVLEGSIPLTWENDQTYPWTIQSNKVRNGNSTIKNSTSTLVLKYTSDYPTTLEFKYDVTGGSSANRLQVIIDGEQKINDYSETGSSRSYRLPVGNHTIAFRDTVYNTTTYYYSQIYDVKVTEFPGASNDSINKAIVDSTSIPLTWTQDPKYPWRIVDGKLQNGNFGFANSASTVSFSYSSLYPTTLEFKYDVSGRYYDDKHLQVIIDGEQKINDYNATERSRSYRLPVGNHTIAFRDTVYNTTTYYYSHIYDVKVTEFPGASNDELNEAIVLNESSEITWINDPNFPWRIENGYAKSGNYGLMNTKSELRFLYKTEAASQLSFKYQLNNANNSNHSVEVYIDNDLKSESKYGSVQNVDLYLSRGEHVVCIVDSISNLDSYDCYTKVWDVKAFAFDDLESSIVTSRSLPITLNDVGEQPWYIEGGCAKSSNYKVSNSNSVIVSEINITKPTVLSFNTETNSSYHHQFKFLINDEIYYISESGGWKYISVVLQPGNHKLEWRDDNLYSGDLYYTLLKDIELHQDCVDVTITPGMLGVETLYNVSVLTDVEMLKVKGRLNESDWSAIKMMTNVKSIDLSEAEVDSIADEQFCTLPYLNTVVLPEGVKSIGKKSFVGTNIYYLTIPSSVEYIKREAFSGTRLTKIDFAPNSKLNIIGYEAFSQCSELREFFMPNSVISLETSHTKDSNSYTFSRCTSLKRIHFSDQITVLPGFACYECNYIEEIHLPQNLISIGDYFMYAANNLKELQFPESLRTIGEYAFAGLHSVSRLILPEKLNSLGRGTFLNSNSFLNIELPSGVSSYDNTFNGCPNIKTIICRAATPPTVVNDAFRSVTKSNVTLEVPSFAIASYKLDSYWYQFGNIIEGAPVDYWKIIGDLKLLNNRRMEGKPDVDLYYNGKLTIGGNAAMEIGKFDIYTSDANPSSLVTDCANFTADEINTIYHVDANKWYFITPMADIDLRQVNVTGTSSYVFRYYDGATRADIGAGTSWKNVSDMTLKSGVGYIFQCNAASDVIFPVPVELHNKVLTNEAITIPLTAHPSDNSANKGWNFVGNPFPSYYDIYYMDFTAPITVWTGSTYRAYSISDDNFVLRPMQGFFVQKPDAVDVITMQPAGRQIESSVNRVQKIVSRSNSQEVQNRFIFNLEISSDTCIDVTRIVLNQEASSKYEIERDASKFMSMNYSVPQIYSIDDNKNPLAINERPYTNEQISLGVYIPDANKQYSIKATQLDGEAYIIDALAGITHDLSAGEYTFNAEQGVTENRFSIRLNVSNMSSLENTLTDENVINVTAISEGVEILNAEGCNMRIYAIDGSLIHNKTLVTNCEKVNLHKGIYVVVVNGHSYKVAVK